MFKTNVHICPNCTFKKKSTHKIETILSMDRSLLFFYSNLLASLHEHIIMVMLHMHIYIKATLFSIYVNPVALFSFSFQELHIQLRCYKKNPFTAVNI